MEFPPDFRFRPSDEVLVDRYLRFKHLNVEEGDANLLISDVNISNFDPWELPFESESEWNDEYVWYFYSREEYKCNQIWKTSSGYWKETGFNTPVIGKWRETNGVHIGEKKVLVFESYGNTTETKSDWVTNEYHATFLPPHSVERKFVICKVQYKEQGHRTIPSTSSGSEVELTPDQITDLLGVEFEKTLDRAFDNLSKDDWKTLLPGEEETIRRKD